MCDAGSGFSALNGSTSPKRRDCQPAGQACCPGGRDSVDYIDVLRRLWLHDEGFVAEVFCGASPSYVRPDPILDARTQALVRLAALVAVGGGVPSYGAHADAAVDAGASVAEIVEVLVAVIPVVGLPSVAAAAPKLALALGHDVDEA